MAQVRLEGAEEALAAVKLDETNSKPTRTLMSARRLFDEGDFEAAAQQLSKAIDANPLLRIGGPASDSVSVGHIQHKLFPTTSVSAKVSQTACHRAVRPGGVH